MSQPPSLQSLSGRVMLTLPSKTNQVSHLESFVSDVVSRFDIGQDTYGNILISLTEAVNNAIIHGNRKNEQKKVKVSFEHQNKGVAVRVSDEGEGFDFDNLPDPTSPERICECGGRGVFLMRALSDELSYTNNGRTVEMCFSI